MSVWVKICGNTTLEDAQLASDLGADAIGFIFANGPRRVSPTRAATINAALRPRPGKDVERIGVFQDACLQEILDVTALVRLSGIQLHGTPNQGMIEALRHELGPGTVLIQALHWSSDEPPDRLIQTLRVQLENIRRQGLINHVLMDTKVGTTMGGTGQTFDWTRASELFQLASGPSMVAAGGLNPGNIGEAMRQLRPWGVDVASGVEQSPGSKDPRRLGLFLAHARAFGMPAR